MNSPMSPTEQFQVLNMLDYLSDLFTAAGKETFNRAGILVVLDCVRSDPDIFDPDVLIAQQVATSGLEA